MHKSKTRVVKPQHLHPQYEEQFRCIGAACEDTCCAGWTVHIDKASYERYQLIPASSLRSRLDEHLVLTPEENNQFRHAKVKMDESGVCPLMDADKLCALQKEQGPDALSHTCAVYPRVTSRIDDTVEKVLLLSCPEAARLVLLEPELMPELTLADAAESRYRRFERPAHEPARLSDRPMAYFYEVRLFMLLLLRDRGYPIWQRLFIAGMFSRRMDALIRQRQAALIPKLLSDYAGMLSSGVLRPLMESIPAQPMLQLNVVMTLLRGRLEASAVNMRFLECVADFSLGTGYGPLSTPEALAGSYQEAFTRYYQPWFERSETIFENYLTNYVFAHLFPFGRPGAEQGERAWREYMIMCSHYALIKGLLIGMAGKYREAFGTAHALKLIQSFVKDAEHNRKYVDQIARFFEINHLNNTNGIAALLRDGGARSGAEADWRELSVASGLERAIVQPGC